MKNGFTVEPIGLVEATSGFSVKIDKKYRSGLKSIEGFSHLQIIWWGSMCDSCEERKKLISKKPYKKGPDEIGVFATRSQIRPNPVLITTVEVLKIDHENGVIHMPYIDAEHGTPVLDIKPYHLNERVGGCSVPNWCKHWPENYENSAQFDWESEFNF